MRHTEERPNHRFATAWAEAEDQASGEPVIVDLAAARLRQSRRQHCPACQRHRIQIVETRGGDRYERCLHCGRLWERKDGTLHLVVKAQVRNQASGTTNKDFGP